jgi:multidrug efflux pump subunit AcrB
MRDVEAAEKADGFMGRIGDGYDRAAHRALVRPGVFVGVGAAILLLVGTFSWTHVQSGFMPKMDEGGFILDYKAKSGAALSDTDQLLRQVEAIIRDTPEVVSYSRRTGFQLGGGLTEADEGDFFVRLKGGSRRPIEAVMTEIRLKIEHRVPVRRQNIWHNSRRRLAECGPRLGVDVRRRACGAASADVRWSVA